MEPILTNFFAKYPQKFSVMSAIKMIHKEVECAQHSLKKDKDTKEYLIHLKKAGVMISDLFAELGESHENY